AFATGAPARPLSLRLEDRFHHSYVRKSWIASIELLPSICRFHTLTLRIMKLKPETFLELIQMRLSMDECDGIRWVFHLTEKF
ncbi:hypothetical protein PENTCL1PPCAC_23954, partial [Pristionchus entomophagus]